MAKKKQTRQPIARPKIRKGDRVLVRKGKDKGEIGEVLRVNPEDGRAIVQGVNKYYRHTKPTQKDPRGGRVHKEMPISMSNLMVVGSDGTASPVKIKRTEDGRRVRVLKRTGEELT